MAIGTPTSLGTPVALGSVSSTVTFTTSVTAPANSLIIAIGTWGLTSPDPTGTMSGGSLTWATDQSNSFSFGYFFRIGIYSAPAVSGLASGTVLTLTYSNAPDGRNLALYYVTGMDLTGTRKDVSTGTGANTASWNSGSASNATPDCLLIGGSMIDGTTTSTATGSGTELADFQTATVAWSTTVTYKIVAAAASQNLQGTWLATSNEVAAFVAYKGSGGGGGGTVQDLVMPPMR